MSPLEFFGVGHRKFAALKAHFPKLKLVGQGNEVKALGSKDDLDQFAAKWDLIVWQLSSVTARLRRTTSNGWSARMVWR